ncbi:hypothetical protein U879_01665 [Defluviimonas sp. 20V17]|uniref:Transcription regulator MerR DNA binding domain-containing protein n=1 Tax=Allgaiera indica TaxID=765699 RepID=A0AAN5A0H4_9RHOB|nr:MerR family DNA-binding protein [Allgaiera indica]KDB05402.1 hypothetical protein U879_01665 [Defluviimonas sp. 20V17]GHE04126.1 hypothetical protein GCM10008024_29980 [Allgaiera indica]
MALSDVRAFAALYASGDKTCPERKVALVKHRRNLDARQAEIDRRRDILDGKLKRYERILEDRK